MSLRLLLALPQLPQDPASGAARSLTTIAEIVAAAGFEVRCLATTASEGSQRVELRDLGIQGKVERPLKGGRPEVGYSRRGITYRLLDVGSRRFDQWEQVVGAQFDRLFDHELDTFQPDILLTYGGSPWDAKRRQRALRRGVRIVFGLRNKGYLHAPREFFEGLDVLTPSGYLSRTYGEALGIASTAIPSPFEMSDVVAAEHDPIFVTMVNPSVEKGLMLFARLAEMIGTRRPDIAVLTIESRGSGGQLVRAGLAGGFDLRRHENLMFSPAVPRPADIFGPAKMLLVPSLWREVFGRVAVEAMLNGVVPLVSDRGGLPETIEGCGRVIAVPGEVTTELRRPVSEEVAGPWLEAIERLEDDEGLWKAESARAREAARPYLPQSLTPRYVEYFLGVAQK